MTSPDAFLSSPTRTRRRVAHGAVSSSPDLPSVQEILSQKRSSRPPLKSGSKAAPLPENATTTFTSASSLWKSLQADDLAEKSSNQRVANQTAVEEIDTSVSVIEIQPNDAPQKRKPRRQKRAAPKRVGAPIEELSESNSSVNSRPWNKYKSPKKNTSDAVVEPKPDPRDGSISEALPDKDQGQDRSCYFKSPEPQKSTNVRSVKEVANEPLNLEVALARRTDWTPPVQKTRIIIDIDSGGSSKVEPPHALEGEDEAPEAFENMLASFKCNDLQPDTGSNSASDDSSFLRKRKLLELVPTSVVEGLESAKPHQSPTRRKAPRTKTRTITGIATAAYRPLTQPDQVTTSLSDPQEGPRAAKSAESKHQKPQPRKRPARPSKKKAPPPKPILLSPGAALNQVARQDFVFGTSSQLAREQSPTLLRDLQSVMRASNQLDSVEFATPLNSDALEAPERQTLWGAGARDADGDLFDVEVRNYADGSGLPELDTEADPFGYVRGDKDDAISLPELPAVDAGRDDGSFVNLSDILAPQGQPEPLEIIDDDSPLSGSEPPAGIARRQQMVSLDKQPQTLMHAREGAPVLDGSEHRPTSGLPLSENSFELYTDAQLAKQIAQYGFKPIKRRTAMIALLTKCRQESAQPGNGVARSAYTTATGPSRSAGTSTVAAAKEKRPRGRPRKVSADEGEAPMQPPPSAQPPESPRRRRGRPRKDAASPSVRRSAATSAKETAKDKSPAPATPTGKARAARMVIEIPDSQSDAAGDSSASACSSPDATFSPAQAVDLSLTLDEDTELSLAMSPTDQQASLFMYITKAVTTAPRTTDPAHPSWHEKMLMYDAIVLEELTTWLNCGQLTRVGCDDEASVGEVKQWCESKSILCLWEKNLRGKERKRY